MNVWQAAAWTASITAAAAVSPAAVLAHRSGIWSLDAAGSARRWVVIHNLDSASEDGVLHLEVLGAEEGAPAWNVRHLADHMAVTMEALRVSVRRPLEHGAVYPERFDDGLRRWRAEREAGRGRICTTSIYRCLAGEW